MRYTRQDTHDWVEFKPGVARLSINEVTDNSADNLALLLEYMGEYVFFDRHGERVLLEPKLDWPQAVHALAAADASVSAKQRTELEIAEAEARIELIRTFGQLTSQQLMWLRDMFRSCARDEKISPEV